jgi:hypothetical protein
MLRLGKHLPNNGTHYSFPNTHITNRKSMGITFDFEILTEPEQFISSKRIYFIFSYTNIVNGNCVKLDNLVSIDRVELFYNNHLVASRYHDLINVKASGTNENDDYLYTLNDIFPEIDFTLPINLEQKITVKFQRNCYDYEFKVAECRYELLYPEKDRYEPHIHRFRDSALFIDQDKLVQIVNEKLQHHYLNIQVGEYKETLNHTVMYDFQPLRYYKYTCYINGKLMEKPFDEIKLSSAGLIVIKFDSDVKNMKLTIHETFDDDFKNYI